MKGKKVTELKHYPRRPHHWQIHVRSSYFTHSHQEGGEDRTWYMEVYVYTDEKVWREDIVELASKSTMNGDAPVEFVAFVVTPAKVSVQVSVDVTT